jgi:hypothetical protein
VGDVATAVAPTGPRASAADGAWTARTLLVLRDDPGVCPDEWVETHAGWLNVRFPLKAWVVHGVDLRNPGTDRSWDRGYADG